MKEKVVIAAVQMDVSLFDAGKNLAKMENAIKTAKLEQNADLIVFPELASTGYIKGRDKDFGCQYMKCADKIPGEFTKALGELAMKYDVYIISGMAEAHPTIPGTLYNSAVLINPTGKLAGVHRKTHIPGYEKHYFIPANTNDVFDTDLGTIGIGICYDNQFAELTRTYALKGAEILVMLWNMPNFSNDGTILHNLTSVRAFENRMYAVSCNRVGENNDIRFFGYSAIANPLGELIDSAEGEDTIIYGILNRDMLLKERAQMPVFRDRRPDLYDELVKPL
ncbi:MAG: carbon-nitrogen hydrolase family protein [Anaerocolumna sp.]